MERGRPRARAGQGRDRMWLRSPHLCRDGVGEVPHCTATVSMAIPPQGPTPSSRAAPWAPTALLNPCLAGNGAGQSGQCLAPCTNHTADAISDLSGPSPSCSSQACPPLSHLKQDCNGWPLTLHSKAISRSTSSRSCWQPWSLLHHTALRG